MNSSTYNKLPSYIKRKHKIVYSELVYDNITLFKNSSEKWGAFRKIKKLGIFISFKCIIQPIYNSTGFINALNIIQAVKCENDKWDKDNNIYLHFDTEGNIVWQSEKGENVRIDKFKNIFVSRINKTGLLDTDFKPLIEPKYDQLIAINENYYKVLQNGKYGIVTRNDIKILDFEFNEIFNSIEDDKVIVKDGKDRYLSFDFKNQKLSKLPFDKILKASSNSYNAPSHESFKLYKSIINLNEYIEHDEYSYEMLKYAGKWGVINGAGEVLIPNQYCFVDFLRNPNYFKVGIGNIEVNEFEDEEQNTRVSIKNVKWGIIDINNNVIAPIEYDWIDEVESAVWVVYKGGRVFFNDDFQDEYWTIENAKLGVYNLSKLITPIEYDSIKKTWHRINGYIFVQKGNRYFDENNAEYDVFTLEGKKIENNKPNPRKYNNNG